MTGHPTHDPIIWRPQNRFAAKIGSRRQLQVFNDRGGIAVNFDTVRSIAPNIMIVGSQSETLSLWDTRSTGGFITKPKFDARLITIRFITSGQIIYKRQSGNIAGLSTHATLVDFDDVREVQASNSFSAISATIAVDALMIANDALTGVTQRSLSFWEPTSEVKTLGMQALFFTLRQIQRRIQEFDLCGDLVFPLVQEIMSYQLLSSWPRNINQTPRAAG